MTLTSPTRLSAVQARKLIRHMDEAGTTYVQVRGIGTVWAEELYAIVRER